MIFDAFRGVCVGQAANPGPSGSDTAIYEDVTLSVLNPTSLYTHHDEIIEHPSDVQFLSETSTTIDAQKSVRSQMRGSGKRVVFGAPSPDKTRSKDPRQACVRGHACGVACITRLSIKPLPCDDGPTGMYNAGRIMRCLVQIGPCAVQCVVIYGLTTCTGQAAANDALFAEAVSWVQAYSGYSILAGDFNMPPSSAPALQPLFQKGFVDVIQYYQSTRSVSLAPTCNEATHNDTMIFPSQMLPWIQRVQTRTDLRLSNHAPLFVHLTAPQSKPDYFVWSLPSSWADLPLPWSELDAVYQQQADSILLDESICDNALDTIDVWKLWAGCVEQSVGRWEPLAFATSQAS